MTLVHARALLSVKKYRTRSRPSPFLRSLLLEKGTEIYNTTYLVIHKQEKGRSKCYHEQQKEKQDLKEKDIMILHSGKIDRRISFFLHYIVFFHGHKYLEKRLKHCQQHYHVFTVVRKSEKEKKEMV